MTREEAIEVAYGIPVTKAQHEALQVLIPELRERDDERIRKHLIKIVETYWGKTNDPGKAADLAYLEKQKERGPLTKDEEYILHRIIEYLEDETCPSEWISLLHDIYCLPYEKQKEQPISAEEVLARAGLKPYKDGNQWCILAGDNIQEGICGFGDTVEEALYEFLMEVVAVQKKILAKPVVGEFHIEDENHSWIDFNKKLLFDEGENVVVSVLSLKK